MSRSRASSADTLAEAIRSGIEAIVEAALYEDDLDAAEAFYRQVLGLEVLGREAGRHVFFRVGDGVLLAFQPEYHGSGPPIERFAGVTAAVQSRFFTRDLAGRRDGEWLVVEIGDGQVSGLPRETDPVHFYEDIARSGPET